MRDLLWLLVVPAVWAGLLLVGNVLGWIIECLLLLTD